MSPTLERRKRYEQIADDLLAQIGDRRLRPGDPVPSERELTHAYGVGRSTVREALRMLESRGVIASDGTGSFAVAGYANPLNSSLQLLLSLEQATMHDLYELRRIIECEAAAMAAARRTEAHIAAMDRALETMTAALASSEHDRAERYIDADLRFHLAVTEAARNGVILHSMRALRDVMRRALMSIFLIPESAERSLEHHRAIRDAIADGDADRARAEMGGHLMRVESDVHHAITSGLVPAVVERADG